MNIVIAGGTGFIGRHLTRFLKEQGHHVTIISRGGAAADTSRNRASITTWQELEREPARLEGTDAIVNLAGASISKKWTPAYKEVLLQSRVEAAERIARLVASLRKKPQVVINSSGVAIYGLSETGLFSETDSPPAKDFLAGLAIQWEKAADCMEGVRLVKLRTGLVIGTEGGAFPLMAMPYRLFVGGRVGNGRQWVSWIHIADMCRLILFCIQNNAVTGPVNAVSPEPITNDAFGRTVGHVLGRPHYLPVPSFAMRMLFGEMSQLLLEGQRVSPEAAIAAGFTFEYPQLEQALRDLLK